MRFLPGHCFRIGSHPLHWGSIVIYLYGLTLPEQYNPLSGRYSACDELITLTRRDVGQQKDIA